MATLEQMYEALRRADAAATAGDASAANDARALAAAISAMSSAQPVGEVEVAEEVPEFSTTLPWDPMQPEAPNPLQRFGQSMYSTVTGGLQGATMGAYDELASFVGAPIKGVENLITGQDSISGLDDVLPFLGRSYQDARAGQVALNDMAFEQAPAAYIAGDIGGSIGLGTGMAARGATMFGDIARPTIVGMGARGALEGGLTGAGTGYNTAPEDDLASRLWSAGEGGLAGAGIGALTGGVLGGMAGRAQTAAVPTVQELEDAAGKLYTAARSSGVTAPPSETSRIANVINGIAQAENVILPSGKVNSTYPKIKGVLDVFEEYNGLPLDVGQMQSIRRNLQDAAKSIDPGERRIATIMLGEFDDFATSVAPELAEASNLYWKAKTGEMIEEAIELAGNRSSQYSQSGAENALRTQFRQLNANIIKGRVKGIAPELAEQIALVASGSPLQNFARWVGKFAVRGPVSAIPSLLAAVAGLGTGTGPIGGALAAGAVALPGEIGRRVAEGISIRNADVASALARSGGKLPSWTFGPGSGGLVQGGSNLVAQSLAGLQ